MKFYAILCNFMQFYAILCNFMQLYAFSHFFNCRIFSHFPQIFHQDAFVKFSYNFMQLCAIFKILHFQPFSSDHLKIWRQHSSFGSKETGRCNHTCSNFIKLFTVVIFVFVPGKTFRTSLLFTVLG